MNKPIIMYGKPVADAIYKGMKEHIDMMHAKGFYPVLHISPNGSSDDDNTYERMLIKKATELGIMITSGPSHKASKPTVDRAVIKTLEYYNIPIAGRSAVVIGRSATVGSPIAEALLANDATVTVCHSKTTQYNMELSTAFADIVVSATGVSGVLKYTSKLPMRTEQTFVDIGCNFVDGKMCGDIDPVIFAESYAYTPVPAGIGPVTIAVEMLTAVEETERQMWREGIWSKPIKQSL